MKLLHRFSLPITLTLCLCLISNKGRATIGLAEWEVYTPGGNVISDSDSWRDLCGNGICLRADTSELNLERVVFISDLKRWRFYQDYMIGETKNEYFIFNELNKEIKKYSTENQFSDEIEKLNLGSPKSPWLTPEDGWEEAWFPVLIWQQCKNILKGENVDNPSLSKEVCQQKLAPERLAQYKERTWGQQCIKINFNELTDNQSGQNLKEFCNDIMNGN